MKTFIGLLILTVLSTSCMNNLSCPTYGNTKKRSATMASAKRTKDNRDRTPYYKTMKVAERD
ncbi:MAG TPA: hypothetical protein VG737_12695 [Cyclobacteriaceae bacterium]|nr:hypothetical protein [Cyclobacteriaceae bacterium]